MTRYRLKPGQESFEVVDGPSAGKKFLRGQTYMEIPAEYRKRFEPAVPPVQPIPKSSDSRKAKAPAQEK